MDSADGKMSMPTILVLTAVVGVLTLIALLTLGGYGFWGGLLLSLIIAGVVFVSLVLGFLRGEVNPAALLGGDKDGDAKAEAKPDASAEDKPAEKKPAKEKPAADKAPSAAEAKPDAAKKPTPAPKTKGAAQTEAQPGTGAGNKPEMLSAARDGKPDNLKEIKGVGPKLEAQLNEMGVYHFDQIAAWGEAEVAWMDENLKGFKGRVSRDDWVAQAKILATGGDTEFSKRVDQGKVY